MDEDTWQAWDDGPGGRQALAEIQAGGMILRAGDHVRLRPRGRADAFDLLLAGRLATVETIEQDYEGRLYLAVTIDDDPGQDYGRERRPAHRFFFGPDEVELPAPDEED